jgi:hypothetical protein
MSDVDFILYFYVIPMVVCILADWVAQLTCDNEPYSERVFAIIAFIPIANIFVLCVAVIILVGGVGGIILDLPTIIKYLIKKDTK